MSERTDDRKGSVSVSASRVRQSLLRSACNDGRDRGRSGESLQFSVGDLGFHITSDTPDILEEFGDAFHNYPQSVALASRVLQYDFRTVGLGDFQGLVVYRDRNRISPFLARSDVFSLLIYDVWNLLKADKANAHLVLRAAVGSHRGQSVLFFNSCLSGKSTLLGGLMSRGWKYAGDSITRVNSTTLEVEPIPLPLRIRSGSYGVLETFDRRLAGHWTGLATQAEEGFLNPFVFDAEPLAEPSPIRFVVLPKYVRGGVQRHYPVERGEALSRIMPRMSNCWAFGESAPQLVGRIIDEAKVCELEWSRLDDACDWLTEYVTA